MLRLRAFQKPRSFWVSPKRNTIKLVSPPRFFSNETKSVLITTPIFYVNNSPHLGHLYSALLGDALARWHRMKGMKTLFATGTDEHGLKIQQAAEKKGQSIENFTSKVSGEFKKLFDRSMISYDDFIRTTEPRHAKAVTDLWNKLMKQGDIYLGKYEGWYCVSDEAFLSPEQVRDEKDGNGNVWKVSVESGNRVDWVVEENYKFKLSNYAKNLLLFYKENPDVIIPSNKRNEVMMMLQAGLNDLSVSRIGNRIKWAIPVPNDPNHTIYVWFDALTNYLTVTGYPDPSFSKIWPADFHIIGKDIIKFHAVYWPAFLMAAGLPLPKKLVVHSHWLRDKVKMSKSLGNVVNPHELIDLFGLDPVRFFLLSEPAVVDDGDFSDIRLHQKLKNDLTDAYGNFIMRCTTTTLNPANTIPAPGAFNEVDKQFINQLNQLHTVVDNLYSQVDFFHGIQKVFELVYEANKYFQNNEPWKLKPNKKSRNEGDPERLGTVLYVSQEAARILSLYLYPIMPETVEGVLIRLGVPKHEWKLENAKFGRESGLPLGASNFVPFKIVGLKNSR